MQAPPPGPIGPGGYPRPEGYGTPQKFGADLAVGIIIIVLNAIGACLGGLVVLGGGFLASGAANNMKDAQGNPIVTGNVTQAAGGMVLIVGIVLLIASIVAIVGGVGIIKGVKWGLTLTFALGVIGVILSIIQFNPIGLVIGLFEAVYCGVRLFGNVGPRPV